MTSQPFVTIVSFSQIEYIVEDIKEEIIVMTLGLCEICGTPHENPGGT
jgi:hypothetical protein